MADDIVTRLRAPELCMCVDAVLANCSPCNARIQAADEIERLRAELAAWQGTVRAHEYLNAKAADEIKQLREAGIKQVAEYPDDIVQRLWNMLDGPVPMTVTREDVRAVLAEIERLRNTLEIVVDMLEEDFPNTAYQCAIDALGNHLEQAPQLDFRSEK